MKIAQYYEKGEIHIGLVTGSGILPVDFPGDMIEFIKHPCELKTLSNTVLLENIRFAPPVNYPSKIIAIGLNYLDHIEESNGERPEIPMIFAKFQNSLTGHKEHIIWDESVTRKVDFEAELAVILGKKIYDCPENEVMNSIFGYTCANDVSARDLQFGDGQWVRGKSLDSFCPLGPWITTADDIPDPHDMKIKSILNGQIMQDSNTGLMLFRIPWLISFLSRYFTLMPGDVILTGTPSGVGCFRDPSIYMKSGDVIVVEIEGIGKLVNTCRNIKIKF